MASACAYLAVILVASVNSVNCSDY